MSWDTFTCAPPTRRSPGVSPPASRSAPSRPPSRNLSSSEADSRGKGGHGGPPWNRANRSAAHLDPRAATGGRPYCLVFDLPRHLTYGVPAPFGRSLPTAPNRPTPIALGGIRVE